MTVQEFVNGYKKVVESNGDVGAYVESVYKTDYVPQRQKSALCDGVVASTCFTKVPTPDGVERTIYISNRKTRYIIFMLKLIELYTDITMNTESDDGIMSDYEMLDECDLIRFLVAGCEIDGVVRGGIPAVEYERFKMFMDMTIADAEENNNNIVNYLDSKLMSFSIVFDSLLKVVGDSLSNALSNISDDGGLTDEQKGIILDAVSKFAQNDDIVS